VTSSISGCDPTKTSYLAGMGVIVSVLFSSVVDSGLEPQPKLLLQCCFCACTFYYYRFKL